MVEPRERGDSTDSGGSWAFEALTPGGSRCSTPSVLGKRTRRDAWSEDEDETLRELVDRYVEGSWSEVATRLPGRSAKQCRERWKFNLSPDINKASWTAEEDALLVRLQQTAGNRWAFIARSFDGRTENAIKTRFRSLQRAARRKWSYEEDCLLLEMRTQRGCRWDTIAAALPKRSKNGVKMRYKEIISRPPPVAASAPLPSAAAAFLQSSLAPAAVLPPQHGAQALSTLYPSPVDPRVMWGPCGYGPMPYYAMGVSPLASPRSSFARPAPVPQKSSKREDEVLAAAALLNLCAD